MVRRTVESVPGADDARRRGDKGSKDTSVRCVEAGQILNQRVDGCVLYVYRITINMQSFRI